MSDLRMGLTVVIIFAGVISLSIMMGIEKGQERMQKAAVLEGHATYEAGEAGESIFTWRERCDEAMKR